MSRVDVDTVTRVVCGCTEGAEGSHNTVTLFLILLHNLLHDSPTNQDTLMREGAVATLGMLMLKVFLACCVRKPHILHVLYILASVISGLADDKKDVVILSW